MDPSINLANASLSKRRNLFRIRSLNSSRATAAGPHQSGASSDEDGDYVHVLPKTESVEVHLPPAVLRQQHREGSTAQSVVSQISHGSSNSSQIRHRKSLVKKKALLSQYQMTSIAKHFAVSRQILAAFDSHWSNHLWVTAYAVGLQFVETALLEIPKHGYFYSDRHERERMLNSLDAARVARQLKELLEQQLQQQKAAADGDDDDEPTAGLVPSGDLEHVLELLAMALEQVEQASSDQDQSLDQKQAFQLARAGVEEKLRYDEDATTTGDWIVCEPLMACTGAFRGLGGDGTDGANDNDEPEVGRPLPPSPTKSVLSATYSILSMGTNAVHSVMSAAAAAPVSTRPSFTAPSVIVEDDGDDDGRHASFACSVATSAAAASLAQPQERHGSFSSSATSLPPTTSAASGAQARQQLRFRSFSSISAASLPAAPEQRLAPPRPLAWTRSGSASGTLMAPTLARDRSAASVASSVQTADELLLEKALFLSGLEVSEAADEDLCRSDSQRALPPGHRHPREPSAAVLELSTLARFYHEDFDALQRSGRIRISFADTFQGRLPESTNGCTVIAPLLGIRHLIVELDDYYYESGGDPGLPDSLIELVIDQDSPAVLSQLRRELGLSENAFLIPADVHDYLLAKGLLSPTQFQTVTGGNILHDDHLNAFVAALEEVKDRKVAATLYFHEHVVAILKLKRVSPGGKVSWWYDLIDSLPLKETLRRSDESSEVLCQRLGLLTGLTVDGIARENDMLALPRTARIRCLDAEALTAFLRWYACSKFNDENIAYIDQYMWDDTACDFDPRVFQAFVWGGAEFDKAYGYG